VIYQAAFLVAAFVCFIVAAAKPKSTWGWAGMAVLVVYVLLLKGKLI
jgi:hypothetical protein